MVEPRHGRQDHRAGLGRAAKVVEHDDRQRRLAGHQNQFAALLQMHVGRAVDHFALVPWTIALRVPVEQGQITMPSVRNEPLAIGADISR